METYKLHVAGLERDLPICPLNDNLSIAGFVRNCSSVWVTLIC